MPARQFGSVVAANRQGLPALGHDRIQHSRHSSAGEAGVHFQGQTLPCVGIHHTQHPDRPPAIHRIVHEVQRPLLVRRRPSPQRLPHPHAVFALLPPDHQSRLVIHPMHPLVVHRWTRPLHAPHPRPSAPPPTASAPRSSAPPCAGSSTYTLPLPLAEIILSFVRKEGSRSLPEPHYIDRQP